MSVASSSGDVAVVFLVTVYQYNDSPMHDLTLPKRGLSAFNQH